jgi:hypothetical protein
VVLALVLQRTRRFGAVALAAGFATGVTIVNVVAAMLWYGAWLEKRNVTQRLRAAIALAAVVGVGLAVLAVPQGLIYRGAGLFFVPGSFMTDSLPHRLEERPRRFAEVVTYLSVANVVAPRLALSPPSREWAPVVTFVPPGRHWFGPVGWLAVGLWLALVGTLAARGAARLYAVTARPSSGSRSGWASTWSCSRFTATMCSSTPASGRSRRWPSWACWPRRSLGQRVSSTRCSRCCWPRWPPTTSPSWPG